MRNCRNIHTYYEQRNYVNQKTGMLEIFIATRE